MNPSKSLLTLLSGPGARLDAAGVVRDANVPFLEAFPDALGARLAVHGRRATLAVRGASPVRFTVTALVGGGWLAIPVDGALRDARVVVSRSAARRLRRAEATLCATASAALGEHPSPGVSAALQEVLAAAVDVGAVARQVEALDAGPVGERAPACLYGLVRDAVGLLPEPRRATLDPLVGDVTVDVDGARLLPALVAVFELVAGPLHVRLEPGPGVARLRVDGLVPPDSPEVEALRTLVEQHGGRMLGGDQLRLELPAWAPMAGVSGAGTVLVVEDDASALAMMRAVLRRAGFRVLDAANGVAASALLRVHADEIDVLVTDAVLPGRSGVELAAEARRMRPSVPVLLVTGHPADIAGVDAFPDLPQLSKPFGALLFAERVRDLLGQPGPGED